MTESDEIRRLQDYSMVIASHMKITTSFRRWRMVAVFSLFMLAVAAPTPSWAGACCPVVDTPDNTIATNAGRVAILGQLGIVGTLISSVLSVVTFLQDTVLPSGFSAIAAAVNGLNLTATNHLNNVGDYLAQTNQYVEDQTLTAKEMRDAVLEDQNTVCAINQFQQDLQQLETAMRQIQLADNALDNGDCQGANANCPSPKRNYWLVSDICSLGLMSPDASGDMAQQMGCPAPADITMRDRADNMAAHLAWTQIPLASACVLPDGFRYFGPNPPAACRGGSTSTGPGAAQANPDPHQNTLAWAAFYKFCQKQASDQRTGIVTQGRPITSNDIDLYLKSRVAVTAMGSAQQICKEALWKRTACPAANPSAARAVGANTTQADNCHALQVKVCNDLKTPPNPQQRDLAGSLGQRQTSTQTGMGITGDPALQNCERDGLSLMKIYEIMAYRCSDNNYVQKVMSNTIGSNSELNRVSQSSCQASIDEFKKKLDSENQALSAAMSRAQQINRLNAAAGTNAPTAQPVR